MNKHNKWM